MAAEMEREGFDLPLLIGGADDQPQSTRRSRSIRKYKKSQAIYVNGRQPRRGRGLQPPVQADERQLHRDGARRIPQGRRRPFGAKGSGEVPPCRCRRPAPPLRVDWNAYEPTRPSFLGTRVFHEWDLAELARYIDWTPFFPDLGTQGPLSADTRGRGNRARGAVAFRRRQGNARQRSRREVVQAQAVIGFWPANAVGDDNPPLRGRVTR